MVEDGRFSTIPSTRGPRSRSRGRSTPAEEEEEDECDDLAPQGGTVDIDLEDTANFKARAAMWLRGREEAFELIDRVEHGDIVGIKGECLPNVLVALNDLLMSIELENRKNRMPVPATINCRLR